MNIEITPNQQQPNFHSSPYLQQAPVMTVKDWILTFIVGIIPLVNIIMLFVWAFGDTTNPNKKNYARASLIIAAAVIALYVLFFILFFIILGASGGFSTDNLF